MTIQQTTAIVFITEDGVQHSSKAEAIEHQFAIAIDHWSTLNCYTGMSRDDVVQAILDGRNALAKIFQEYVL